jgi:hypothetical protein
MSPVAFVPIADLDSSAATLLGALRSVFSDTHVAWAGFDVGGDAAHDWLIRHTLEGSRFDLGPLLLSLSLATALPAVAASVNPDRMACFEPLSPFSLCGDLAQALIHGGADITRRLPADTAYEVAHEFADALLGRRVGAQVVLRSRVAWSGWFASDVWDRTWVVADQITNRVWLLCVTDVSRPLVTPLAPTSTRRPTRSI